MGARTVCPCCDASAFAALRARKGDWLVQCWLEECSSCALNGACGLLAGFLGRPKVSRVGVVYTEEEFAKLTQPLAMAVCTPGVKAATTTATFQQVANRLWNSGSTDHHYLKQVSPTIMSALYSGKDVKTGGGPLPCCSHWERVATERRITPDRPTKSRGDKDSHDGVKGPRADDPPNGGNDDDDANARGAMAADQEGTSETSHVDDAGMVWGVDMTDAEDKKIRGRIIGPCPHGAPVIYANTPSCLEHGINKRMVEKKLPFTPTPEDRARIGSLVGAFIKGHRKGKNNMPGLFSDKNIDNWCAAHPELFDCKSNKWTDKRFETSVANLLTDVAPEYKFTGSIKAESMAVGKAPRVLIADGDPGQLMALLTVKCIEDIVFEHFEGKSIKHRSKEAAMQSVVDALRRPNKKKTAIVEGDGTAWDARCGSEIRGITENPIIEHVTARLMQTCIIPAVWLEEHEKAGKADTLKLFMKTKRSTYRPKIDAIRRSGHRGTSILNWLVNFILWHSSVFKDPGCFANPRCMNGVDSEGKQRWFHAFFEGDDSIVGTDELPAPLIAKIKSFWTRCGFEMKLIFGKSTAEFTGFIFGVDELGLTGDHLPDPVRGMRTSGVSASRVAIESNAGRAQVGRDAMLARAQANKKCGMLCQHYLKLADMWAAEADLPKKVSHETEMQLYGHKSDDGLAYGELVDSIRDCYQDDGLELLGKLGYAVSEDEATTFKMWPASLEGASLLESLPLCLRA